MGTLYAERLIQVVGARVSPFSEINERTARLIKAYIRKHYPEVKLAREIVRDISLTEMRADGGTGRWKACGVSIGRLNRTKFFAWNDTSYITWL